MGAAILGRLRLNGSSDRAVCEADGVGKTHRRPEQRVTIFEEMGHGNLLKRTKDNGKRDPRGSENVSFMVIYKA